MHNKRLLLERYFRVLHYALLIEQIDDEVDCFLGREASLVLLKIV